MQKVIIFILMLSTAFVSAQNVVTDSQTYSAQQLIEDILIDSNCITNVQVTNVIGGNFGSTDKSYGYFDASGTTFPFQSGIVLSTGRLNNVNGPNTTLSDDNATNWLGDSDLETALNENNTSFSLLQRPRKLASTIFLLQKSIKKVILTRVNIRIYLVF